MNYQDAWEIKRPTTNCLICGDETINNYLCEECAEHY
jgi:hypothetical protein